MTYYRRRNRWGKRTFNNIAGPYTTRRNKIQELAKTPALFYSEVFSPTSEFIESIGRLRELLQMVPVGIIKAPKFHSHFGAALTNLIENNISIKKKSHWANGPERLHNSEYTNLIKYCEQYIDDNARSKIVDMAVKYNRNFYSYGRKSLSKFATEYLKKDDERALDVLREFYRIIPTQDFDKLIDKIPGGLDNDEAKNILSKTKLFEYLKYDEATVNSNFKEKVKLTRAVAKTPTLIKRLPFVLKIDKEHIKKISPATRFKFLQFAFKHEITNARKYGSWNYGDNLRYKINASKRRVNEHKLVIEPISVEEMKELLFAVCLQKNDEFAGWLKEYERYLTKLNAKDSSEAIIK